MSNITVTDTKYNITVAETDQSVTVSAGDTINVTVDSFVISTQVNNTGSGAEVGKEITGDTLFLRTISSGDDIVITENANDIEIALASTIDANLTGDTTGTHFGPVTGDLTGNVTGNLTGDITSAESSIDVINDVDAINNTANNITITPQANGYLHANTGNLYAGSLTQAAHITSTEIKSIGQTLEITGNLTGDVTGDVTGDLTGSVTGDVVGNLTGDVTGTVSSLANHDTDDLAEGNNLYYTQARFDTAFAAKDTGDLTEGSNLYYTDARFDTRLATKTTTDLTEGDNLYYTQARFDTAFAAKDTGDLTEGSNLYYTAERVDDQVNTLLQAGLGISLDYNDADGELTITSDYMEETVKNATATTIPKGTPVYVTGISGDKPTVEAARADDATKMPAIGVLNEDIAADAEGSMLIMGRISGVDTSAFSQGDTIYVAPTGGYTNTKPTSVDHLIQNLGFVTKVHASNGGGIVYGSGRSNDTPNEITHTIIPSSTAVDLGRAGSYHQDNTQSYFGRIYGQMIHAESIHPRSGTDLNIYGSLVPSGNVAYDLGSPTRQWREAYIGPGSLYIDGQKVLGSDENGDIDITTDDDQGLNISAGGSGTDGEITMFSAGGVTTLQDDTINLGPVGATATINARGTLEAADLHVSGLEIEQNLINNTGTGANLEIRTDGAGYLHANVADFYVGPISGAVKIDENSISATAGTLTVTGNLTGDVTGTVSDVSNHTTDDISEGTTNLYHTTARAREAISASGSLSYNSTTGVVSYTQPTNVSTFTNDAGYITDYTVTEADVTAHQAALSITESQISDLSHYTDTDAITAVQNEATLDLTGAVTIDGNLTTDSVLKVDDGLTLPAFNPYGSGTNMPTNISGIGQEDGWAGLHIRNRGEHDFGLGFGNFNPRALLALAAGRKDGGSDDYLDSGDDFGYVMATPYSGYKTGAEWLTPSAAIVAQATENHSASGMGTKLVIQTTTNGNSAGAQDGSHTNGDITFQGTSISSSGDLELADDVKITGDLELNGDLNNNGSTITATDSFKVVGGVSTENTVIGEFVNATYDYQGIQINAGDTAWAGMVFEEYEGGADKPINAFTNPGFQTTVYGGTPGSQAALSSGKRIMALNATAANSSSGLPSTANIRILGETTETQSSSARGAKLLISTTPNGSTSPQQTLTLSEGNTLTLGNSTYQSGNATIEAGGGDLQLGSALDTNNKDIKNSLGNVKVNDNLDVTGNLNVDGSLTVDGAVTLGDANTDAITVNGPMTCINGLVLTSMDTGTANYLAGVLGIIDEGAIAYITDGDGGNKCIAVYDGSNWKRISFGANISST